MGTYCDLQWSKLKYKQFPCYTEQNKLGRQVRLHGNSLKFLPPKHSGAMYNPFIRDMLALDRNSVQHPQDLQHSKCTSRKGLNDTSNFPIESNNVKHPNVIWGSYIQSICYKSTCDEPKEEESSR